MNTDLEILRSLEKQIKNLKEQTENLKKQIEETIKETAENYVLKLEVSKLTNSLRIFFKDEEKEYYLGRIDGNGKCRILSSERYIESYNIWREHGKKIDNSIIEWRDGLYRINTYYTLERTNIINKDIYDFDDCKAISYCNDNNIIRFKHNMRPIIF